MEETNKQRLSQPLSWKVLLIMGAVLHTAAYFLNNYYIWISAIGVIGDILFLLGVVNLIVYFFKRKNNKKEKIEKNTFNLFNRLVFTREEIKNKWWHRLFTVFLFGSSIIVFIISVSGTIELASYYELNDKVVTYHPVKFSLEPGYQEAVGKEFPCEENYETTTWQMKCEGVTIPEANAKHYYNLYKIEMNNLLIKYGLDKYDITSCLNEENGFTSREKACVNEVMEARQSDSNYASYVGALKNVDYVKAARDIHGWVIFRSIALFVFAPILITMLWILLLSFVLYRLILYVIFGNKNE
jgi:hypothetical protein